MDFSFISFIASADPEAAAIRVWSPDMNKWKVYIRTETARGITRLEVSAMADTNGRWFFF
jgi:hypothetical protein